MNTVMEMERQVLLYRLALPLMWALTLWVMFKKTLLGLWGAKLKVNTMWFDGLIRLDATVKGGVASWRTLDVIYNPGQHEINSIDSFWLGMVNSQAVRNRLKLVSEEIHQLSLRVAKERGQEVRIFSIACGSARAVIEVLARLKAEGVIAHALLTDVDESALQYAQGLAVSCGVGDQVSVANVNAVRAVGKGGLAEKFKPNIIEMVGLMDYLTHEQAVNTVRRVYSALGDTGGFFIAANIRNNPERYFVKWVIDWNMIYRSPIELASVIGEAGFDTFRVFYEPHKVHGIVVAER